MNFKLYLALSLSIITLQSAVAQIDSVFVQNYGGPGDEAPGLGAGTNGSPNIRSISDNQGNIYITSYTNSISGDIPSNAGLEDIIVTKTSSDGQLLWSKTFGGTEFDRSFSIKILSDGNLLLCGRTASNNGAFIGLQGGDDGFLLKITPDGLMVWSRLYGGTLTDTFFDILELPNGDIIACGISGSIDGDVNDNTFVGSNKAWLMRFSSAGVPIWSRITNALIDSPDWEESFWFARLNNAQNSIYLLGASYNFNDINSDDLFLSKFDLNGMQQFKTTFGGNSGDSPAGLTINQNDEVYVFGTIRGSGNNVANYFAGNADAWLVKLNASGSMIWEKNYGGTDLDYAYGLTAGNQSLFLSMSSRSIDNTSSRSRFGLSDGLIVEVSSENGDTLSTYRWGSTVNDYSHDLIYINENEFYAIGRSSGNDEWISQAKGGSDLVLIKYQNKSLQIDKIIQSHFSVFPNPTNGLLQINIPENYHELCIYDNVGKLVLKQEIKSCSFLADLNALTSGLYQIHIHSNQKLTPLVKKISRN